MSQKLVETVPDTDDGAALTVDASAASTLEPEASDIERLGSPARCRVNYVVRNLGVSASSSFVVSAHLDGRSLDRHSYTAGLDAGRALASYFRFPLRSLGPGEHDLVVSVENSHADVACRVRLDR